MVEIDLGKVVAKDYEDLSNKPKINDVELSGNNTLEDLGIASKTALEETNYKVDTIIEKADLGIKNIASGEEIHLTDSAEGKAVEYSLYGKATQDGTPTPTNPVEIEVSGASGSVEVKSCGKNLLPYPYQETTHEEDGIVWTDNGDGTVKASGTATAFSELVLRGRTETVIPLILKAGTYILSGCPQGGSAGTYRIHVGKSSASNTWELIGNDIGNGFTFTLEKETQVGVSCAITSGVKVDNLLFKPMIRKDIDKDNTWQPYREPTLANIPTPNGLAGIKVSSGGNYTDQNGQQWICDEVVKYADGSGAYVQRIGKTVFDGSEDENIRAADKSTDSDDAYRYGLYKENIADRTIVDSAVCSHLAYNVKWQNGIGKFYNIDGLFSCVLSIPTLEEFKTWLGNNPMTFVYPLKEPITTPLTAEQLADIETFYPVTNISNDFDCGMNVKYTADAKNYIDNQLALQARAREEEMIAMFLLLPEEAQARMIENDTNNLLTESEE